MDRKKASDFDQELLNIFDEYVHGAIDRRGFLDRAARFAAAGMTAAMLLDALNPRFAETQQGGKGEKRLKVHYVGYESPQGNRKGRADLARPGGATGQPAGRFVRHWTRGLQPHNR